MNFPLATTMNHAIACGLIGLGIELGADVYYKWEEEDGNNSSMRNDYLLKKVRKVVKAALILQTMPTFWAAAAACAASPPVAPFAIIGSIILAATHLELIYDSDTNQYSKPIIIGSRQITQYMNAAVTAAKVASIAPPIFAVIAYLGVALLSSPATLAVITITFL